jgi:acetyltransferase-like isoleucine patch superfamily enzyme
MEKDLCSGNQIAVIFERVLGVVATNLFFCQYRLSAAWHTDEIGWNIMNNMHREMDSEITKKIEMLKKLYQVLREDMQAKFQRDLPLAELLFDRWERAETLGFGKGTSIYHNSYVYGDVSVGKNTWIGPFTILDGTGGLKIGSFCSISAGVQIYTHDSVKWAITGGKAPYEHAPVKIGDRCYIGPNSIISRGVTIGDESIIGAGSLVLSDIPPKSKAWGYPAKIH